MSLIGSVAKELSKIVIYSESKIDSIVWTKSNLIEQNGVLIWAESNEPETIHRNIGGYFNFCENDVETIQNFINKFGFVDLDAKFLKIFAPKILH